MSASNALLRCIFAALALNTLEAGAQQAAKTPRVGVLFLTSPASRTGAMGIEGVRAALADLGYVEGRSVVIEYRTAEGRAERLPGLAADLVARKVDVIVVGGGNVSALAARKATTSIPIVMTGAWRAVESGLVENLARPGGNVTGLSIPRELALKQIELLREIAPSASRLVVFARNSLETPAQRAQSKANARDFLGITIEVVDVEEPDQLERGFAAARAFQPHALIIGPDPMFFEYQDRMVQFARDSRLPAIYPFRGFVEAGGLVSYSVSTRNIVTLAARYVDRVLKGAKPADLPVEEPTMYELAVNLGTAKALGVKVPQSVLLRADEVIE